MTANPRRTSDFVTDTNVIFLPQRGTKTEAETYSSAGEGAQWADALGLPGEFTKIIESAVTNAIIKEHDRRLYESDDPFDAIYIARLEPDNISGVDLATLSALGHVADASSEIEFDDGWDD